MTGRGEVEFSRLSAARDLLGYERKELCPNLQTGVVRKPCGSLSLIVAGEWSGDPEVETPISREGLFRMAEGMLGANRGRGRYVETARLFGEPNG